MPDGFFLALNTPGLIWLAATFVAAGLVRGFTGFGTALIFMPVALIFLPLPVAIVIVMVTGMLSWPVIVPRAFRDADRGEVAVLAAAAVVTAPLGVWLLTWVAADVLRWIVSGAAAVTLLALLSGWRFRGRLAMPGLAGVGALAGVLGGTTGLTGPPVILFYLAGPGGAAKVRANTILFLALLDIGIVATLFWNDLVPVKAIWLGVVLAVPYLCAISVGQALFRPDAERAFRLLAYSVIGVAIVSGLPIWG